ncbi:hypothetical protein WJX84_002592, partial [Apatococcus fuscideae]
MQAGGITAEDASQVVQIAQGHLQNGVLR